MDSGPPADHSTNKTKTGEMPAIELSDHDRPHGHSKVASCSSSSTSSDSSDGDDFFQLDPAQLDKPMSQPKAELPPQHEDKIHPKAAAAAQELGSSGGGGGGPTQSPQVQVMGRCDVPDPNRIPSSIFARSNNTMEWSVASNESLFSIHMGNSSFSRDQVFLMGSPMDGYAPSPPPPHSPLSGMPGSSLPPLSPVARPVGPAPVSAPAPVPAPVPRTAEPAAKADQQATKDALHAAAEEQYGGDPGKEKPPVAGDLANNSARLSRQSDGSATSFRSFAFPILTGEGRNGSGKVEAEHQPQTPQTDQSEKQQTPKAEETPKTPPPPADAKGWLSCFSCCPFCR